MIFQVRQFVARTNQIHAMHFSLKAAFERVLSDGGGKLKSIQCHRATQFNQQMCGTQQTRGMGITTASTFP